MVLRELGLRDEAEIFAVIRTAFAVAPWNDDWHSAEEFHAYFLDILGNRNSLGLGLWEGEALVALALGRLKHWFDGCLLYTSEKACKPRKQTCRQGILHRRK